MLPIQLRNNFALGSGQFGLLTINRFFPMSYGMPSGWQEKESRRALVNPEAPYGNDELEKITMSRN
jgi:hypothetical protein